MIARRTFMLSPIGASAALSGCQFGYDASELVGRYRAEGSRIDERLTLFDNHNYLHEWNADGWRAHHEGNWQLAGNWIHLLGYVRPGRADGEEAVFIPGPQTFFFFGGPTFFSRELGLKFVRAGKP